MAGTVWRWVVLGSSGVAALAVLAIAIVEWALR